MFTKLAEKRYSVRKFTAQPLSEEIIDKLLRVAELAPTGCNRQPQRILVINTPESINRLYKCTKCHFNAPTALLVCYNKDECWYRPYDNAPCGPMDASIVATHIMMEATELGVGTTWVMHFIPEAIREEFSVPQNIEPVALLVMGYPSPDAQPYPMHSQFRPRNEMVVYDCF